MNRRRPPVPELVLHSLCDRCGRLIWSHGVATECLPCMHQAARVYGLGPIQGGASGS